MELDYFGGLCSGMVLATITEGNANELRSRAVTVQTVIQR
jgi:hypothetical protein